MQSLLFLSKKTDLFVGVSGLINILDNERHLPFRNAA